MPRLTEARRQLRLDVLLQAARAEFADHGYDAASISRIARRADVSDGLLYRYFTDKRALLATVLEDYMARIIVEAEATVLPEPDFRSRIERLMTVQFGAFAQEPALCRLFIRELRDASGYGASPLHAQMRRYTALVLRIAEDAKACGEASADHDPRLLRDLVFGGIEHIVWRTLANDEGFDVARTASQLAGLIAHGVVRREQV